MNGIFFMLLNKRIAFLVVCLVASVIVNGWLFFRIEALEDAIAREASDAPEAPQVPRIVSITTAELKARFEKTKREYARRRTRRSENWRIKIDRLERKEEDAREQLKAIECWKTGRMDRLIDGLFLCDGEKNARSADDGSCLENFRLSAGAICFDYRNGKTTVAIPKFRIDFFDGDGNLLGSKDVDWGDRFLAPGERRSERADVALPSRPHYYRVRTP